jgi:recombinational DNA repair ATPase RecF
MPLGLWKGSSERHRELMIAMDSNHRETMVTLKQQHAETMATLKDQHAETMATLKDQHAETMGALTVVTEELIAMRKELTLTRIDLTDAINANTEAVLKLIDRFDRWEGRPPGPPDLRSV